MMKGEKQRRLELPVRLESRGLSVPDQGLLEQNRLLLYKHCKKGTETQGGIGGGIITGAVEGRKVVQATCRGFTSRGQPGSARADHRGCRGMCWLGGTAAL